MPQLNQIGIDKKAAEDITEKLNDLLSNYSVFYMNVRGYHWNLKGQNFFELHVKFEELYNNLALKIDEISERILTLGKRPFHSYSVYIQKSHIPEARNVSDGLVAAEEVVESLGVLISKQRALLKASAEREDEGTHSLVSDYIKEQEKTVWMYRAFLGKK